jgi:hypothetical protein
VTSPFAPRRRRPPGLYRLSRGFRRLSLLVLVLILLFVATVAYSAFEVVRSSPTAGNFVAALAPNDTVVLTGHLNFSNPGLYPISGFTVHVRVLNASGLYLGDGSIGPVTLPSGSSQGIAIMFDLPISNTGPGASLLTTDQYLNVSVWGNATYAYLFPISIAVQTNKSWGAPFANLAVSVGAPSGGNGTATVPVTVQFQNHAKFIEDGSLDFSVVSPNSQVCGTGSFAISVFPGGQFDQTTNIGLSPGCSPAGGHLVSVYVGNGATVPLPQEAIP